jgi:hypothetical protein
MRAEEHNAISYSQYWTPSSLTTTTAVAAQQQQQSSTTPSITVVLSINKPCKYPDRHAVEEINKKRFR